MRKARSRAAPMLMLCAVLTIACAALPGCIDLQSYDAVSHRHALQADRNVGDINNGLDDAAIDAAIENAWEKSRGLPPDATPEQIAAVKAEVAQLLRSYAVSDIEREIDKRQSQAWIDHEAAKAPDGTAPPEIENGSDTPPIETPPDND